MKSSYIKNNFSNIFKSIVFCNNPKVIVEFGILDGYSLDSFLECSNRCEIKAYDIFDKFNGNKPNYNNIINKYKNNKNVSILKGDFYKEYKNIENNSIDILHVDIANDGDVYEYCINKYYDKLSKNGIMILEGGSIERDNVKWMKKYNKRSIKSFLDTLKYPYIVIEEFPSITIIKKIK